jgi:D-ribose pyranose/furanose isomerase RbsD
MEERKLLNDLDHDFSVKRKEKQFATSLKIIKNEMPIQVKAISHEIHESEQRLL